MVSMGNLHAGFTVKVFYWNADQNDHARSGIGGVLAPLLMQRLKFDPTLASPILVTTTTDALGYFFYLGMATVVIASLV